MQKRWNPGDVILEEGWNPVGMLVAVRAETVVEDSERCLALYSAAGATYWSGDPNPGSLRNALSIEERMQVFLSREPMEYREFTNRSNVLLLREAGVPFSVWLFWDASWNFRNWYVNLESPYERSARGISATDHHLDIVIAPDLTWRWKDEDEFEAMYEAGAFSAEEHAAVRAAGLSAIRRVEKRAWPFDEDWPTWRSDPSWPVPRTSAFWTPPPR